MTSCLHVVIQWLLGAAAMQRAACGVVDTLRHSNAEYRGTSRELGNTYRPQVSFQN